MGADVGSRYVLRLAGAAADPGLAAAWHARLLQLDMYLAAGMLVPADPARFRDLYGSLAAPSHPR